MLTFRVIWKVPPHLAASTNPCCHHGNTASSDNMWTVRCVARVHAFTQAPLRDNTYVHGFTVVEKHMKQTDTHIHAHINTSALHYSSVLHFIYPSFPSLLSLNETMSTAHNQAPGPAQHCQKGAHDPIFSGGSIISVP